MPTLDWIGKKAVLNHHRQVPYRLLHCNGKLSAGDPDGKWAEDWARGWGDTGAGQPLPNNNELTDVRKEIDQRVLTNLLRINLMRSQR